MLTSSTYRDTWTGPVPQGFAIRRWQTVLAIDSDRWACETYRANFPGVPVHQARVGDCLDALPSADIILAGPPCQPHSVAGRRGASTDERDGGADFVAALRRVRPRHFLMENVPGLLTSEGGRYWRGLFAALEESGYAVRWKIQDAVEFGVPQFRRRLWIWGIRADLHARGLRHCWPVPTHEWPPSETACMFGAARLPGVTVGQALGLDGLSVVRQRGAEMCARHGDRRAFGTDEPSQTIGGGNSDGGGSGALYLQSHTDAPPKLYRWSDAMLQKHPPASLASPASTIEAKYFKGGAEGLLAVAPWKHKGDLWVRRLTALECARLQSVPDDFAWPEGISKTAAYRVIGNGWACAHAAAFGQQFTLADPDALTALSLFCGGGLGDVGFHGRFWRYERDAA